jgi:hypothetical protein
MPSSQVASPTRPHPLVLLARGHWRSATERISIMTKTFDVIADAIRNTKHPFRKADNRPKKAQKHRYERRKIKEYMHLGELSPEQI